MKQERVDETLARRGPAHQVSDELVVCVADGALKEELVLIATLDVEHDHDVEVLVLSFLERREEKALLDG